MSAFEHLDEDVRPIMLLPTRDRVHFAQEDRWIGYTRARQVIQQLDDLLSYPRTLRTKNFLIVGRSGNGKSAILREFAQHHVPRMREDGTLFAPVVNLQMPASGKETDLWSAILWALSIHHRTSRTASEKQVQVKSLLRDMQTRLLIIDEFSNLKRAGKAAADLLAVIKNLTNELNLSVVAAGTEESVNVLSLDPQMKSRFEPAPLDRWNISTEYLRFLFSYERLLPLAKPSNLASREMAPKIYALGGEAIGNTVNALKVATKYAIDSGRERIDADLLKKLPWTAPSEWETLAPRL